MPSVKGAMLTKRDFLRTTGLAALTVAAPASSRAQVPGPKNTKAVSGLKVLKIGGGGNISGLDIAADGTKVIRTDVYGAYRWNSATSQWEQLINSLSMPSEDVFPNG